MKCTHDYGNNCSIIDYALVQASDFGLIRDFKIGEASGISDHCCLDGTINTHKPSETKPTHTTSEYIKWDQQKANELNAKIQHKQQELLDIVNVPETSIDNKVKDLTDRITMMIMPLMGHT